MQPSAPMKIPPPPYYGRASLDSSICHSSLPPDYPRSEIHMDTIPEAPEPSFAQEAPETPSKIDNVDAKTKYENVIKYVTVFLCCICVYPRTETRMDTIPEAAEPSFTHKDPETPPKGDNVNVRAPKKNKFHRFIIMLKVVFFGFFVIVTLVLTVISLFLNSWETGGMGMEFGLISGCVYTGKKSNPTLTCASFQKVYFCTYLVIF